MSNLRYEKRPTKKLAEITGCDMLSAAERLIQGQIGGYYSMGDESAYFRFNSEKPQLTLRQLEIEIQKIHPYFCITFNPTITPKHISKGHQIAFFIPEVNGFIPLCCVGHSGDHIINAHSTGSIASYRNAKSFHAKQQAIVSRGYIAAKEFCKLFIWDMKKDGGKVNANKIVDAREFLLLKVKSQVLGGSAQVAKLFADMRKMRDDVYEAQQTVLRDEAIKMAQEKINKLEAMTGLKDTSEEVKLAEIKEVNA